jgi:hypothetical protein
MAQIVLSVDETTWVGKELYPGEQYYSFDKIRFNVKLEDIVLEPDFHSLQNDIYNYTKVNISKDTPNNVIKTLCKMLCQPLITNKKVVYFSNLKAKYGVSAYIGEDIGLPNPE